MPAPGDWRPPARCSGGVGLKRTNERTNEDCAKTRLYTVSEHRVGSRFLGARAEVTTLRARANKIARQVSCWYSRVANEEKRGGDAARVETALSPGPQAARRSA